MTSEFKPFAVDGGANVVTQAEYEALLAGDLLEGFEAGLARSNQMNKVWRQASVIAAAVSSAVSQVIAQNLLDNGDVAAVTAQVVEAFTNGGFTTGDTKVTMRVVAPTGWIIMDDGTIGNAASGATTRANADCSALFTLLWTNAPNASCPVSGGRGASAAADFAANKTLRLPQTKGRALGFWGLGSGLTARQFGESLGAETHSLTADENGTHSHEITVDGNPMSFDFAPTATPGIAPPYVTQGDLFGPFAVIADSGLGDAHNNMQPSVFLNLMVKL